MAEVVKDNANPTIISASELPTRKEKGKGRNSPSGNKKDGLREIMMAKPSFSMDPFYMSDFSDTDSDDSTNRAH